MKIFCLAVICMLFQAAPLEAAELKCTSTQEYVTTLEFLRGQKMLAINEGDARKTALHVSTGCSGAAKRFIRVAQILMKADVGSKDALEIASRLALKPDAESDAFLSVFKMCFVQDSLDLTIAQSLRIARTLSTEFDGDIPAARDDFEKMVAFCISEKELDLPRLQCGELAAHVARQGRRFGGGMVKVFKKVVGFARSDSGLGLTIPNAVRVAEAVTEHGPAAADNFIQAWKYGISKNGLGLGGKDAMDFARLMAARSVSEVPEAEALKSEAKH